ncbi:YhgE/Pip family protein [Salinifilum ghardaiensis]
MRALRNGRSRLSVSLTLVGLLLVPVAITGVLTWALGQPQDRMGGVKAAIVNNDDPVEVDGKPTPLGRQLSATLVGDDIDGNYDWELANPETAREGLDDGTYAAVVTIPENFSAAATSFSGDPGQAEKATIDVTTGDRGKPADEAISGEVTRTATQLLGDQLTTTYLDNLYIGFNTLGDRLGDAADGATSLADGARQLSDGTEQLATGADELAGGTRQLSNGLGQLDDGAAQLSQGTSGLADGLEQMQEQTAQLPQQVGTLADVSAQENRGVQQLNTQLRTMSQDLSEMSKECPPGTLPICNKIAVQAAKAEALSEGAGQVQQASDGISTGLDGLAGRSPDSGGGLPALAGGIDRLAAGAQQLDGGAGQLSDGLSRTTGGADQLADGADQLAGGIRELDGGADQLGNGSEQLSQGLHTAVEEMPSYPDGERDRLARTVADPVTTTGDSGGLGVGTSGTPLYAVLALWIGALATFLVLRALPADVLRSTRSAPRLLLRRFGPSAGLAVVQGLLVTAVLGLVQDLSVGQWFSAAGLLTLAAVAFTAVNQALAAAFGGAGRFLSMLVALAAVATGVIAAVPRALGSIAAVLPTGPATRGLRAIVEGSTVSAGGVVVLVLWLLAGLVISFLVVERSRTVRTADLRSGGRLRGATGPA